jgi:transcriptional regulator with XRE-family HTH domain
METTTMGTEIDETAITHSLGANVREHREQAGLSQGALADLANIHRTYLNQVENGRKAITVPVLVRLSRALDITPAELLQGIA